jgi:hypothetical protein
LEAIYQKPKDKNMRSTGQKTGGVEFPLHWSLPYSPQEIPL